MLNENEKQRKGIWIKYKLNPVLGDSKVGTLFDPYIMKKNGLFKMYVSWRGKGNIAFTTSKNGINWSELQVVLEKGYKNTWEEIINKRETEPNFYYTEKVQNS